MSAAKLIENEGHSFTLTGEGVLHQQLLAIYCVSRAPKFEDALNRELEPAQSGRVLGGAFGRQFAYIDLLLFDGNNSLEIVQRVLREQNLPTGTAINFFAKEKQHRRIVL